MTDISALLGSLNEGELRRLETLIATAAPNARLEEIDLKRIVEAMREIPEQKLLTKRHAEISGGRLYELTLYQPGDLNQPGLSLEEAKRQYKREWERARELKAQGLSCDEAWQSIREPNLFSQHIQKTKRKKHGRNRFAEAAIS